MYPEIPWMILVDEVDSDGLREKILGDGEILSGHSKRVKSI